MISCNRSDPLSPVGILLGETQGSDSCLAE
jgi:hypothetical protein